MDSFHTRSNLPGKSAEKALYPGVTVVMAGMEPMIAATEPGHDDVGFAATSCHSLSRSGEISTPPAPGAVQQAFPPLTAQAANLFQSAVAFVGDGCGIVDDVAYRKRLEICRTCDRLKGDRCTDCGCWIKVKARGRIFRCSIDRW